MLDYELMDMADWGFAFYTLAEIYPSNVDRDWCNIRLFSFLNFNG